MTIMLFNFRTPSPEESAAIRFKDEVGVFSFGELLNALWLQVAVVDPDPDWLQWYRLVARLIGYARLDVSPNSCETVRSWATCPAASCAGAHVFRDDTGKFSLAELTRVIERLATSKPLLARRLSRMIIHIAEIDQERDRIARALLDWEELPVSDD